MRDTVLSIGQPDFSTADFTVQLVLQTVFDVIAGRTCPVSGEFRPQIRGYVLTSKLKWNQMVYLHYMTTWAMSETVGQANFALERVGSMPELSGGLRAYFVGTSCANGSGGQVGVRELSIDRQREKREE